MSARISEWLQLRVRLCDGFMFHVYRWKTRFARCYSSFAVLYSQYTQYTEIAFEYCPFNAATSFAPRPDYKEQCRQVATGVCKGSIKEQVNNNGCGISNAKLEDLQAKCRRQVNRMTGAGGNNPIGNRPTPRPTNRPTNRPSRRPRTNRPSNRPTPRPTERTNRPTKRPTRR